MDESSKRAAAAPTSLTAQIFPGESEMAQLMRATDWAATPLGPVATWSPSLRMMVRFLLPNRFPLLLWWGPDFVQIYNDPYRPVLGAKHPKSMGQPASECWREIWDVIGPLIETPFNGGPATWSDDLFLEINRHGFMEETHFTIAYSPVPDEDAAHDIGGVLATVHEITEQIIGERRVVTLRDLAARSAEAKSAEEACQIAAHILEQHTRDIPFALLYLLDADGKHARLAATSGIDHVEDNASFCPRLVSLDDTDTDTATENGAAQGWPLDVVMRSDATRTISSFSDRFEAVPPGPWSDPPTQAVVVPIRANIAHQLAGFLVAGVSARLRFDDAYGGFYELVSGQLSTAITNARAYEEERKRAEALATIDRAKTTFFSNVSHEFRTPLTLLLGPLEDSLADPAVTDDPRQRERLEVMRRNASRLLKLVNTLLDFARIEAGRVQAVYEPTDLCASTAELASAFRSLVEKAGLTLVVDCPPLDDLPAPVYIDREMWEKIVLNLLSNAFKFTFDGSITVKLAPVTGDDGVPRAVELMVRDTGTGIPAAELPRLFERFRRVEGARSRTYEGSGIGLALVQELVKLHGGTIWVESVEGVGTTFFVRLPLGADHLPADHVAPKQRQALASTALGAMVFVEEAGRWLSNDSDATTDHSTNGRSGAPTALSLGAVTAPGRVAASNGHRARILVVDDNSDMRDYLRRLLSERFVVEAVANGAQALAAIKNHPGARPDLVLADVMMPELDGFGLLRAIRADPATATLPVILLSARAGEEATVEGLEAGADDYLVKPFSGREALSRIEARLEIVRMRAETGQRTRRSLDAVLRLAQTLFETPDDLPVEQPGDLVEEEHRVAHRLALLTCEVLGCTRVGIIAIEPETELLRAVALVGLRPEQERQWWAEQRALEARGARLGEGADPDEMARFRAGEVFVLDMTQPPYDALPNPYQITTSLFAPMRAGDRLVGMLSLDFGGPPHVFTQDERTLAAAVAHLGAVALEREHLLRVSAEAKAGELAAVEARRRMDDFMGIASHELRTPLTSITANVQMARRQFEGLIASSDMAPFSAEQQTQLERLRRSALLLERMDRQVARMDRLVSDLVDSARIQTGKLELRPEVCDLLAITQEAVQEQRSAWPHRAISVTLPRRSVAPIYADADRIGQVVTNLLTNALKYSPDDAPVAVTVHIQGNVVRVEVRDQGPGLSAKQQAHLFERFYRAPGIEQQSGSGVGLGLGLNICKNIVERHGGAVGVTSAPGEGSAFWFTLPLQRESPREVGA